MTWTIDGAHTSVAFVVRHMGLSKVRGRFTRFSGEVEVDPGDITSARGRVEVELASVDTGSIDRDEHLRSPDFFDVQHHPTMVFETRKITQQGRSRTSPRRSRSTTSTAAKASIPTATARPVAR